MIQKYEQSIFNIITEILTQKFLEAITVQKGTMKIKNERFYLIQITI